MKKGINWKSPAYAATHKFRGAVNDKRHRCGVCFRPVVAGESIHRGPRNKAVAHATCVAAIPVRTDGEVTAE